jgi:hypothetical protein
MELRDYQHSYIYAPIIRTINENLVNPKPPRFDVLGLSTSAGKTFTITNFCAEYCFDVGCDVIITSPNAASLDEIKNAVAASPSNPYMIMAGGFTGQNDFHAPITNRPVILLCHPTYLSQNQQDINKWTKHRNVVVFSDEAHQGFMCSGPEDTEMAYGYAISDYTAAWHSCLYGIDHVAWFLFSATPLQTTEHYETFNVLSEYFDKANLCEQQAAVKSINLYGNLRCIHYYDLFEGEDVDIYETAKKFITFYSDSLQDNLDKIRDKWNREDLWLKEFLTNHPDFPRAKPARAIQAKNTAHATELVHRLGHNTAIAVDREKWILGGDQDFYLRLFNNCVTSQKIFDHVADISTLTNKLVANRTISTAVNISNLTSLVSFHERPSIMNRDVTTAVEQVLGRMVRFPKIEGISNWHDAIDFVENKISQGKVSREDAYKWLDIVFKYDVHMVMSENNLNGIAAYYSKQSYNPSEWQNYINELIVEWQAKQRSVKSAARGKKTPHAQKGNQSYKDYKKHVRECEYCQIDSEYGVPACKIGVVRGHHTEEEYWLALDVHHINGREDLATMNDQNNLMTVCRTAHVQLDDELRKKDKEKA